MTTSLRLPFQGLVYSHVTECIQAIEVESTAVAAEVSQRVDVNGGKFLSAIGTTSVWSFAVETAFQLPIGVQGRLFVGSGSTPIRVELVAYGDSDLVISSSELLPLIEVGFSHSGYIDFTPAGVLGALQNRLDDELLNSDIEESLALELIAPDPGQWTYEEETEIDQTTINDVANTDQERAASKAVKPGLRFTWGPPGTGKTKVLAHAVTNAAIDGQRVLVLSHSNVAIDVAMLRTAQVLEQEHDIVSTNQVLRVGAPRLAAMAERSDIIPEGIALERAPEDAHLLENIATRLREISVESRTASEQQGRRLAKEAEDLRSTHRQLGAQIAEIELELIQGALVIGTTLAKAVIDDTIWAWEPDVIIVDEASMANLPYLLALSLRNPSTLSCFGDFRQLPPIAIASDERARRWFGQDIFEFARVRELYERGEPDERTSILRVQFRMGESICESVNKLAYDGLLRTHPLARNAAIITSEAEPLPGSEIVIVNTSGGGARCDVSCAIDSFSRANLYSAAVSATIGQQLAQQFDDYVGVLSPYSLQAHVLTQMVSHLTYVESATVHRFQGGERLGIVVDLTDDGPQTAPSLLSGKGAELSMRLMNVAASRAKGKLILVGNLDFIEKYHPVTSGARRLIYAALESGAEEVSVSEWTKQHGLQTSLGTDAIHWYETFESAVYNLLRNIEIKLPSVECNLPFDSNFGLAIQQLVDQAAQSKSRLTIRGPGSNLNELESDSIDKRLQIAGSTPWISIGSNMIIGSTNIDNPAVVCNSPYLRTILHRHFLPSE